MPREVENKSRREDTSLQHYFQIIKAHKVTHSKASSDVYIPMAEFISKSKSLYQVSVKRDEPACKMSLNNENVIPKGDIKMHLKSKCVHMTVSL